jgi:hypothetical protein
MQNSVSLILKYEYKLIVIEKLVLRRIFSSKRAKETGRWGKLPS